MKPQVRWPLHPTPRAGEALSSWLEQVAIAHHLTLAELFGNLGDDTFQDLSKTRERLDLDPPRAFLRAVSHRTGLAQKRLRGMTIAGLVPRLLDTLEPSDDPAEFMAYVHQHAVLLTSRSVRPRTTPGWRVWLPPRPRRRACPVCLTGSDPVPRFLLVGQIPLTLSCPEHGCYLESIDGVYESFIIWTRSQEEPRPAPLAVQAMDHRTDEALRTGAVILPRRPVTAAVWFRILRTILDELATFPSNARRHAATLDAIWASTGQLRRAGQSAWCPYESLKPDTQDHFLAAAAAGIAMIEARTITPAGPDGQLFLPEPPPQTTSGLSQSGSRRVQREMSLNDRWKEVIKSLEEVVALARTDPGTADQLYRFFAWGPDGPDTARRLLSDLDIALPDPSHNSESYRSRVVE